MERTFQTLPPIPHQRPPKKWLFQKTLKGGLRNIEGRFCFEGLSVSMFRIMMIDHHLEPEKKVQRTSKGRRMDVCRTSVGCLLRVLEYTLVQHVPVESFKNLQTENVQEE